MEINNVGVIGGGQMGGGIAELCVKAGVDTVVVEVSDDLVARARAGIEKSLAKAVEREKLTAEARDEALTRLSFATDLRQLADRDLVIEAVIENEELKRGIFRTLDETVTSESAILASNTSSIPITRLAQATSRPGFVIGMHFFNPAPVMPLLEVISTVVSAPETVERAAAFGAERLGKVVVRAKDRAGFIVNMLLVPYIIDAIRMYESGFASKEDIDQGMVNGAGYPMGPLALSDLIGLDTMLAVAESLYEEFREPRYAPPPLLKRMVEAGLLGRKVIGAGC